VSEVQALYSGQGKREDATAQKQTRTCIPGFADFKSLIAVLRRAHTDGYAVVVHQQRPAHASIAVALGGDTAAAIALAGEIEPGDYTTLAAKLRRTAAAIMGGKKP